MYAFGLDGEKVRIVSQNYRAGVIGLGWMGMLHDLRPAEGRIGDRFDVDDIDRPTPELDIHRKFHYHNMHLLRGWTPTSYS